MQIDISNKALTIYFKYTLQEEKQLISTLTKFLNVATFSPLIRKKKAPVSLATARATRVFPVPAGPYSRIPLGG